MATRKPLFIATDGFHEEMADADDLILGGLQMGGPIDMGSNKITDMAPATASGEALAWGQAGAELDGLTINPGSDVVLSGGGEVTGLPNTPGSGDAAASKTYVDSVAQGLDVHESVRAATTGPLALGTAFEAGDSIDNVTLVAGDRILIKDQASGVENGIYIVQGSGAPVRAADWPVGYEAAGAFVFVEEGDDNADNGWVCTNDDANDTTNTDALTFSQFSGAGQIVAGDGLTKDGNTLDVGAGNGIQVNPDDVTVLADILSTTTVDANAVVVTANGVSVRVDDDTIEGDLQGVAGAESLRVKDGGIDNQHIDPDINFETTGNITTTAGIFSGDGSGLTNLPSAASTDAITVTALKSTAGTVTKGSAVYLTGFTDPNYLVEDADADVPANMPAIGVMATDATDTTSGVLVIAGQVENIDTSAWSVGDGLWVDDTTPGVLTNVRPDNANTAVQKIGQVIVSNATTGVIQVVGAGRSNDIPNIAQDNLWIGNSNGVGTATPVGDGLDSNPGSELQVNITPDIGLHFVTGALEIEIDPTPDTLKADAAGLGVTGLPLNFKINDVATDAAVTASGVNNLFNGSIVTGHSHPGSGSVTEDINVNEAVVAGDPVYWDSTADRVAKADASVPAESEVMGLAVEAEGTIGQDVPVIANGLLPNVLVGATPGVRYWLNTGGGLVAGPAAPTGSARRLIRVGWAVNATDLWVDIHDYGRRRV